MKYKHYSFDLWGTLIKSNPEFKKERASFFHKHFNRNGKTLEEVIAIIREVDIMCNYTNELIGKNIDAFEMYAMVLYKLGYEIEKISDRDIQSIYHTLESMFERYPSVIYDNTIDVLKRMSESGCTLSILSNTAFIRGHSLKKFIASSELANLFSFHIYSDEIGISKPNKGAYLILINAVFELRKHNPVTTNEIIHIGDNFNSDIKGAQAISLNAFQINTNHNTIKDVL